MDWKKLIGAKDFTELVTEARLRLGQMGSGISNWVIGGVLRTMVELGCYGLSGLYKLLVKIVPMGFLKYAKGTWLDLKADELGLERHQARAASGVVVFGRNEAAGAVRIPARSIVKTETTANGQELRYITAAEVILLPGELTASVPVTAEFEGAAWNVGSGYIRVLVTHIPGVDYVVNAANWLATEGIDREDDDSLRGRCYLQWHELSMGSTAKAYESWTYKVDGVLDVAIVDDHPRGGGTVDVIIVGPSGAPSEALKTAVKDYIDTRRPLCSDVLVKGPTEKAIDLTITLFLHPSTGNETTVRTQAESLLQDFFVRRQDAVIPAQRIGQDFVIARLIQHLMTLEAVINVKVASPLDDIAVEKSALAVRGQTDITAQRVDSL